MPLHVRVAGRLPGEQPKEEADERERAEHAPEFRRSTISGNGSNVSVFDASSPEELHSPVSAQPPFSFMEIAVIALCRHPSPICEDDI